MLFFGIIGYLMIKMQYEPAPLVLALVLGPQIEESFCQSLISYHGDLTIFFKRPISAGFMLVSFIMVIVAIIFSQKREKLLENTMEK